MPLKPAVLILAGAVVVASGAARAADAVKGKAVFERCAACHAGGPDKADVGPSLAGVFGRAAASAEDFRYSNAMRRSKLVWDEKTLDGYLADPQGFLKGNRMPFAGVPDAGERADLIAYIKTLK